MSHFHDDEDETPPIEHWIYDKQYAPQIVEYVSGLVVEELKLDENRQRTERVIEYVEAQIAAEEARRASMRRIVERVLGVLAVGGLAWVGRIVLNVWKPPGP